MALCSLSDKAMQKRTSSVSIEIGSCTSFAIVHIAEACVRQRRTSYADRDAICFDAFFLGTNFSDRRWPSLFLSLVKRKQEEKKENPFVTCNNLEGENGG